ncbi:hypothetical protein EV424DRAFT_505114 [Suillus variegatus]|nr:hypothetical protein EV424DRAFT_505114 [Suillus variegatus]
MVRRGRGCSRSWLWHEQICFRKGSRQQQVICIIIQNRTSTRRTLANVCIEEHAHVAIQSTKPFLAYVKGRIAHHFGIKDLGPIMKFLGIQFERSRSTRQLWMHGLVFTQFPRFHVFAWTLHYIDSRFRTLHCILCSCCIDDRIDTKYNGLHGYI